MTHQSQLRRRDVLLASLVAAVPFRSAVSAPTGSSELPTVRWGMFRNYQPVFVGIAEGFFADAGVRVELTGAFTSGPAIVQAAGMGEVDAGHTAISALANAAAQGIKVVGVADSQTEFADAPLQQWFALDGGPIKIVADLKGRKIGTNSLSGSFYYTALLALKRAGLSRDDVQFVVLPHDRQEQALRSRQIDVAGLIDPYSVAIRARGNVRRVFTGADVLGERQFSTVFFSRSYLDANGVVVEKFLKGYRRSIDFIQADPEKANADMARALGLDRDLVVTHRYTAHANVRLADAEFWLGAMRDNGELARAPDLKATAFVTDRFNVSA
jgi:NitT/TauT family transport system substrate-binding protein